ncbi:MULTISPECIES: TolC family protein [Spirosoma]|uniref:TolC family protein n=1 Tax=Spirosoma liriopis TaxID=2937440 RepID=A0ABT0HUM6_9BACT|nr:MULTISPECIES: TolC family protein [Spirosoma]MCK8495655.1 TolC family protein [Spirosoma liriopis]UHG91351.1 TolC family protein [Spirosoma oryzicola]
MKFSLSRLFITVSYSVSLTLLIALTSAVCLGQKASGRRLMMFGQSTGLANDTVYLDIDQDIAVQLLPFDEMVKIAIANSPLIKYQNEVANSLNSSYQSSKVQILQNLGGYANYSGGNQSIISSGTAIINRDPIGQIANGYRVGVDLRMSLYDLFGRKHQLRQAYSNYRAAVIQKETIEQQIKRELITLYQDMSTTQQILKLRLVDEQASLAAYRIAEIEIQKGKITAELLASATSRYIETKTISEQVKGEFLKNVHIFETLMGVPIQRLKRN